MAKPNDRGELCEIDPKTGKKVDARLWDGMLDGDTRNQFDLSKPAEKAALLRKYPIRRRRTR